VSAVSARVQSAVNAEVQRLRADQNAILQEDVRNRIAAGLESNLEKAAWRPG
jgi:hypothetical protein